MKIWENGMRLLMTLLVRDEDDIIRENILYHLHMGVDFIIATDNKSVDGTPEILHEFQSQGVLHLITEQDDNYAQGAWVTRMARLAIEQYQADWVIHSDADEFWWPQCGTLASALEAVPAQHPVASVSRFNFVPRSMDSAGPWYEEMIYRERLSTNIFGHPLPHKVCHRRIPGLRISQGNHAVEWPEALPVWDAAPIEILHFPMRSYTRFENKITKGGAAYERNVELCPTLGGTWRWLYQQWKAGMLAEFYREQICSDTELQQRLGEGALMPDFRLCELLRELLAERPAEPSRTRRMCM